MRGEAPKLETNETGGMSDRYNTADTPIYLRVIETLFSKKVPLLILPFSLKPNPKEKSFNLPANKTLFRLKSTQIQVEYMNVSLREGLEETGVEDRLEEHQRQTDRLAERQASTES